MRSVQHPGRSSGFVIILAVAAFTAHFHSTPASAQSRESVRSSAALSRFFERLHGPKDFQPDARKRFLDAIDFNELTETDWERALIGFLDSGAERGERAADRDIANDELVLLRPIEAGVILEHCCGVRLENHSENRAFVNAYNERMCHEIREQFGNDILDLANERAQRRKQVWRSIDRGENPVVTEEMLWLPVLTDER